MTTTGNSYLYHSECFARTFDTPEFFLSFKLPTDGECRWDSRQWGPFHISKGERIKVLKFDRLMKTTIKVVLEISGYGMQATFTMGQPGKMGAVEKTLK